MNKRQASLFEEHSLFDFPSTRYQGSKNKLLGWIWENVEGLDFETALDAFGGTGSVAYLFKKMGKKVVYNDLLKSNYTIGLALIENDSETLTAKDIEFLMTKHQGNDYSSFIEETFHDIYFYDEENVWLDMVVNNIERLRGKYKKALAFYALFQACIIKRPYNLFHRKNLYMRSADVDRSFGNKATWDTPFEVHFRNFVEEANSYVYNNGKKCKALCWDAMQVSGEYDLVYIDTPYISSKGIGVDYYDFYHFLEGLVGYKGWPKLVDYASKHRRMKPKKSPWTDKNLITEAFDKLFERYKDSKLVVSYRSDGIPSPETLISLLKKYKGENVRLETLNYKYVLSTNGTSSEILCVAG